MNKEEKICTIINGHFSYILKVDGIETSFTGSHIMQTTLKNIIKILDTKSFV